MKLHRVAAALALSGLLSATAHAAVVSITPSTSMQASGTTFTLNVGISGLGNEIVSAFDLNIYFDPAVIRAVSYSLNLADLGGAWADLSTPVAPGDGSFDLFAYSLLVDPTDPATDDTLAAAQTNDSFRLFTLTFEAFAPGVSQVSFGLGGNERDIVGRNSQFLQVQYNGACVAVNPVGAAANECPSVVPEPATYGLVGLALFAAGLARRRAAC